MEALMREEAKKVVDDHKNGTALGWNRLYHAHAR